jgi:hypothetical protein
MDLLLGRAETAGTQRMDNGKSRRLEEREAIRKESRE